MHALISCDHMYVVNLHDKGIWLYCCIKFMLLIVLSIINVFIFQILHNSLPNFYYVVLFVIWLVGHCSRLSSLLLLLLYYCMWDYETYINNLINSVSAHSIFTGYYYRVLCYLLVVKLCLLFLLA